MKPRPAVLTKNVTGRVMTWKAGTKVLVTGSRRRGYSIERVAKTPQPLLVIANHMCGVPRSAFRFTTPPIQ